MSLAIHDALLAIDSFASVTLCLLTASESL